MKNFSVKVDGKEYWISRSVAVVGFFFRHNTETNQIEALVEKRGKGAADYRLKLCVPCGYLDFDETAEQAVVRELYEECGVEIPATNLTLFYVNTNPSANRQNISLHYTRMLDMSKRYEPNLDNASGGEENEVEWAKWIPVLEYNDNASGFVPMEILTKDNEWAFGHNKDIKMCLKKTFGHRFLDN